MKKSKFCFFESMPLRDLVRAAEGTVGLYVLDTGVCVDVFQRTVCSYATRVGAEVSQSSRFLLDPTTLETSRAVMVVVHKQGTPMKTTRRKGADA